MASTLDGLTAFMEAVLNTQPWLKDPSVVPMPWNNGLYSLDKHGRGKHLCFAVMWDDGMVKPHPPIRRALEMTKNALIAAGHKGISTSGFCYEDSYVPHDSDRLATVETP